MSSRRRGLRIAFKGTKMTARKVPLRLQLLKRAQRRVEKRNKGIIPIREEAGRRRHLKSKLDVARQKYKLAKQKHELAQQRHEDAILSFAKAVAEEREYLRKLASSDPRLFKALCKKYWSYQLGEQTTGNEEIDRALSEDIHYQLQCIFTFTGCNSRSL